jgi:hypothetical protein
MRWHTPRRYRTRMYAGLSNLSPFKTIFSACQVETEQARHANWTSFASMSDACRCVFRYVTITPRLPYGTYTQQAQASAFARLDQKILCALRITNKSLTDAAEEQLYRESVIALNPSGNFFESKTFTFYRSVVCEPRLAKLVKKLSVELEARLVGYYVRDFYPHNPANYNLMLQHGGKGTMATECVIVSEILRMPVQRISGDALNLRQVPGLSGLTQLCICAGKIDWQ